MQLARPKARGFQSVWELSEGGGGGSVEGGPLVVGMDSRGTGYSGTDGPGGPFIPNMNCPGGPVLGGGGGGG